MPFCNAAKRFQQELYFFGIPLRFVYDYFCPQTQCTTYFGWLNELLENHALTLCCNEPPKLELPRATLPRSLIPPHRLELSTIHAKKIQAEVLSSVCHHFGHLVGLALALSIPLRMTRSCPVKCYDGSQK